MKVVRIDWIDSCASNLSWVFLEDLKENVEPIIITTYGVVFQETDKVITVAQNYGYNPEQVCSLMTIPKGCIQSIKEIDNIEKPTQKGEEV